MSFAQLGQDTASLYEINRLNRIDSILSDGLISRADLYECFETAILGNKIQSVYLKTPPEKVVWYQFSTELIQEAVLMFVVIMISCFLVAYLQPYFDQISRRRKRAKHNPFEFLDNALNDQQNQIFELSQNLGKVEKRLKTLTKKQDETKKP